MSGATLEEIVEKYPEVALIHMEKIKKMIAYKAMRDENAGKLQWNGIDIQSFDNENNRRLAVWLDSNIRKTRAFASRQLYIYGPTCMGKTTLIENLSKYLSIYHIPRDEDFYDYYSDSYDLCVLDEFRSSKTIQWLNQFLDGSTMTLRQKGSQFIKKKNIPTIIVSNYSLRECYMKVPDEKLETLERRLVIINVTSPINIVFK